MRYKYNLKYCKFWPLVLLIAVLTLVSVPLLDWALNFLESSVPMIPGSVISIVSTLSFVYLTLLVLNAFLWKIHFVNYLLMEVPDISGRYKGTSNSKQSGPQGGNVGNDIAVEITQNASHFDVKIYQKPVGVEREYLLESLSTSIVEDKNIYRVQIIYRRTQGPSGEDSLIGCCRLNYKPTRKLGGKYFNERHNHGVMDVEFESKELEHEL